jgi:DNA-binding winged helix-turn-helix (wHTH) protein
VTRAELRDRLWPADFVSFEDGLNIAVRKLRQALNDSAESARLVETIPKRGYRFMAIVEFGQRPALGICAIIDVASNHDRKCDQRDLAC